VAPAPGGGEVWAVEIVPENMQGAKECRPKPALPREQLDGPAGLVEGPWDRFHGGSDTSLLCPLAVPRKQLGSTTRTRLRRPGRRRTGATGFGLVAGAYEWLRKFAGAPANRAGPPGGGDHRERSDPRSHRGRSCGTSLHVPCGADHRNAAIAASRWAVTNADARAECGPFARLFRGFPTALLGEVAHGRHVGSGNNDPGDGEADVHFPRPASCAA
jgi:hypothetical protein